MQDRSKGRGQMKCSPWFSRLGVGREADSTQNKFAVTKPWRKPRLTHRVVAPVKQTYEGERPLGRSRRKYRIILNLY
jgi:hypothetical protein